MFHSGTGAITLEQAGNAFNSIRVVGAGAVRIANGSSGDLFLESINAQSLSVVSAGDILSYSSINASAGSIDIRSTGGSINLAADSASVLSSSANISVTAANDLFLQDVVFAGYGGSVTLASSSGVLDATGAFVSAARWLTYLTNPSAGHVLGPFGSPNFRQVNAPIGTAPAVASGNGNLWSDAATVSASLAGAVTKVYDGTVDIAMAGATLGTPTGFLFGEAATSVDLSSATGILSSKNVGTGVVGLSATPLPPVLDTGSVPTYGYQIGATSGNIATVTARPLEISASCGVPRSTTAPPLLL